MTDRPVVATNAQEARIAELEQALKEMCALGRRLVRENARMVIDPFASLDADLVKRAEAVLRARCIASNTEHQDADR